MVRSRDHIIEKAANRGVTTDMKATTAQLGKSGWVIILTTDSSMPMSTSGGTWGHPPTLPLKTRAQDIRNTLLGRDHPGRPIESAASVEADSEEQAQRAGPKGDAVV